MNEIRRVLHRAGLRLLVIDFFRTLSITGSVAIAALIVVLLVHRLFAVAIAWPAEWLWLFGGAAGLAVLAAGVWSLVRRARGVDLAREVDERANLRESLSTAMCVSSNDDAWARMVVETARQKAVGVDVRRAIPMAAPRFWPVPMALALSMTILWFSVPHADLLGVLAERQMAERAEQETLQVKAQVDEKEQRLQEALARAGINLDEDAEEAQNPETPQSAEELRRAAIRRITRVQDQLSERQQSEQAQQLDALRNMMRQVRSTGPGPLEDFGKSLQRGQFDQARQALEELSQQIAAGDMSPEDQARLQEQLQRLGEQLQQVAERRDELERQLQQAGVDPERVRQIAGDPEQVREALEQLENLTDEQREQLAQAAQSLCDAGGMCSSLGQGLMNLAEGMGEQGMDPEAMDAAAGQLSELEMMALEMDWLDAAWNEACQALAELGEGDGMCEGGECAGCQGGGACEGSGAGSPWAQQADGSGLGPGRQSNVRNWGELPDFEAQIQKQRERVKSGEGPIIASRLVQGDQIRGESTAEFLSVVESGNRAVAEAIEDMLIAPEHQDAVKRYYGRLERRAREQEGGER